MSSQKEKKDTTSLLHVSSKCATRQTRSMNKLGSQKIKYMTKSMQWLFEFLVVLSEDKRNYHETKTIPTNSTGKTEHFFAIVTFLSGADITALGVICWVLLNHHKLVSLSTYTLHFLNKISILIRSNVNYSIAHKISSARN